MVAEDWTEDFGARVDFERPEAERDEMVGGSWECGDFLFVVRNRVAEVERLETRQACIVNNRHVLFLDFSELKRPQRTTDGGEDLLRESGRYAVAARRRAQQNEGVDAVAPRSWTGDELEGLRLAPKACGRPERGLGFLAPLARDEARCDARGRIGEFKDATKKLVGEFVDAGHASSPLERLRLT